MCDESKVFRDREFDSQVAQAIEQAQQPKTIGEALDKVANIAIDGAAQLDGRRFAAVDFGQIEARVANQQTSQAYKPTHGGYPTARAEVAARVQAVGPNPTGQQKKDVVISVVADFYLGEGEIDLVGLLAKLEAVKGKPLSPIDLAIWGRVAGLYAADRQIAEIEALPEPQRSQKTAEAFLKALAKVG